MRKPYYYVLYVNGQLEKTFTRWLKNDEWEPIYKMIVAFSNARLQDYGIVFNRLEKDLDNNTLRIYYETYREVFQAKIHENDKKTAKEIPNESIILKPIK